MTKERINYRDGNGNFKFIPGNPVANACMLLDCSFRTGQMALMVISRGKNAREVMEAIFPSTVKPEPRKAVLKRLRKIWRLAMKLHLHDLKMGAINGMGCKKVAS